MIPNFDTNGYLPPGCIRPSLNEFKERFVDNFSDSITRNNIFDGYKEYCKRLIEVEIAEKQWVNGSFTTNKTDPNDIDFVTIVDGLEINKREDIHQELNELFDWEHIKEKYKCDSYQIVKYPEGHEKYDLYLKSKEYWSKWWTSDRKGIKKGVIEFNLDNNDFNFEGEI